MRLFEITNTITPAKLTPGTIAEPKDAGFGSDDQEELGRGSFGAAFSTPAEPGTVRKIVGPIHYYDFINDAYYKYIQLLAKNDRFTNNLYFPKIFDVQVKKWPIKSAATAGRSPEELEDRDFDFAYAVDMERLHDWSTLSSDEALMLGNKMFHNYEQLAANHIKNHTKHEVPAAGEHKPANFRYVTKDHNGALIYFLHEVFNDFFPEKRITIFKDPALKQAIMLIRHLNYKTRFQGQSMFLDIHSGNIMIRRGPGGPHLVFIDPVANG